MRDHDKTSPFEKSMTTVHKHFFSISVCNIQNLLCILLLTCALCACAGPMPQDQTLDQRIAALPPEDPAIRDLAFEAKAQHYMDDKQYYRLRATLDGWTTPNEGLRSLNWSKEQVLVGRTLVVAYTYMDNLLRMSKLTKVADLQYTAEMITVYTYAVTVVDGAACIDPTGPDYRVVNHMEHWSSTTWRYLAAAAPAQRKEIVDLAFSLERRLEPLRTPDSVVCGGGAQIVPTQVGQVGTQVHYGPVNDDRDTPQVKSPKEAAPLKEAARARLSADIDRIIQLASTIQRH